MQVQKARVSSKGSPKSEQPPTATSKHLESLSSSSNPRRVKADPAAATSTPKNACKARTKSLAAFFKAAKDKIIPAAKAKAPKVCCARLLSCVMCILAA